MTTTQPESLRLAEILNDGYPLTYDAKAAAAELRRQHARITELEAQLAQRFDAAGMADSVLEDAARYRWLRDQPFGEWKRIAWPVSGRSPTICADRDAAIDAAMNKGGAA